jgi:hypothetical protein
VCLDAGPVVAGEERYLLHRHIGDLGCLLAQLQEQIEPFRTTMVCLPDALATGATKKWRSRPSVNRSATGAQRIFYSGLSFSGCKLQ